MEFNRFGGTIPGNYHGCCACDIIQNFNVDPDGKASIQLVDGDGGMSLGQFAGPTYRDIFSQRIRFGTFGTRDMPNHAFLAIITEDQLAATNGKAWLKILRETGFEFIRTVSNSVYSGAGMLQGAPTNRAMNHIFGLFRNIGNGAVADPFTPPKAWTDLPSVVPELWEFIREGEAGVSTTEGLSAEQRAAQREIWDRIGPAKLLTEKQVVEAGAPVILAGVRSKFPPQEKAARERLLNAAKPTPAASTSPPTFAVFPTTLRVGAE